MVQQTDLMTTFAAMFETTLPPDAGEDSFSILPLLKGETNPVRQHGMNHRMGAIALRYGDWKYIRKQHKDTTHRACRLGLCRSWGCNTDPRA